MLGITIQEEKIKEITSELKGKLDNRIPEGITTSGIKLDFSRSINKQLYRYYKLAKKIRLKNTQQIVFSLMKYFRKHEINAQQGRVRMKSKKGQEIIKLITERYDRPVHIVDMLSTFIGTQSMSHGLGFYRYYYEPVYKQELGYICVEESLSINQQAHTLIHELVHAKFQDIIVTPDMSKDERIWKYAENEVVAESVAFVLSRYLGIQVDEEQSKSYIKGYMPQALRKESIDKMMEDVERISLLSLYYLGFEEQFAAAM